MIKLIPIAMLALMGVTGLANANALDDIRNKAKADKLAEVKSDKAMLESGEMSLDYAQRYVDSHAKGAYFRQVYVYIYADKIDQIPWTPQLLRLTSEQTRLCNSAKNAISLTYKENALIKDGFSGDNYTKEEMEYKLSKRGKSAEERANSYCMGTDQAQAAADAYVKRHPEASANQDLFSK